MELADLTATELLSMFHQRKASPVEAVESCLARIERAEPAVNAIQTLCAQECLDAAKISEARWKSGSPRLLEGVPAGLKDIIQTAGILTTGGSKIYADFTPERSASVVDRLEQSGALILAKLQTYEFAIGDNSHYGPTRNPWNLERTPGGSSTGSAAAISAGEMPLAVGTDTGGSIRVPATLCGISGLKPTLGRVSRDGVMLLSWTLDHVGPMARSAEDAALMLTAIAGHDPRDPISINEPTEDYSMGIREGVEGLRLGIPADWFFDICDSEVEASTREAVDVLASEGAEVLDISLPAAHLSDAIGWTIMYAEFASLHEVTFHRLHEYSAPLSQEILASAQFVSAQDYLRALRGLRLIQQDFENAFERVDAIVVPGMASVAPRLDDMRFDIGDERFEWGELVARMTMIFNLAGIPALSVPSGLHSTGLPVGIQIAARPFAEALCFRIGYAYQRVTGHHRKTPPLISGSSLQSMP